MDLHKTPLGVLGESSQKHALAASHGKTSNGASANRGGNKENPAQSPRRRKGSSSTKKQQAAAACSDENANVSAFGAPGASKGSLVSTP